MTATPPAKSAVRRAGSNLRRFKTGECTPEQFDEALKTVIGFRAQFSEPLVVVQTELRRIHEALNMQGEPSQQVTQRLKKLATILDKLTRESGLDLSRMQDIGGCRMVVETLPHLRLVEEEVRRSWGDNLGHVKDYIESPRDSGYRAVHMIVKENGFQIEIQLRTEAMHSWAVLVEAFSGVAGENFKQDGGHLIQDFLRLMSEHAALSETGVTVSQSQLDRMHTLRNEVIEYLDASNEA
ncbi:hypothetical protein [Specibacter sp. NPDC078692]|uniref:hypothetical protein n=1 Tax=Specibacter sp. NPDC078692 TaxID=3155818 RepID=UPI00342B3845